ncbi:MAG TPA: MXAN_5187 C-terminal domain-containing protein [Thermoanaerobaculia bacterium]
MDPKRIARPGPSPAPSPSQPKRPGVSEAIDQLARDVQQLRIDFERFFSGALPFPPEELRNRVQAQLRQLRGATLNTAVDNFRLGDLEARYNSYNELFNRRLRDQEEGRHHHVRLAPAPEARRFDAARGIVFGERLEPEAVQALYQGLVSAPGDSPRFDLDSFQSYLAKQVNAIREKTGCSQVQFRLATEDGKVKLKARPLSADAAGEGS